MKKNKGKNKKKGEIIKTYSLEETKKILLKTVFLPFDINHILENLGADVIPKFIDGDGEEKDKAHKEMIRVAADIFGSLELDTHKGLMEALGKDYWGMAKDLTPKIIVENDCKNVTEKMLAEILVNAFGRTLDSSRRLTNEYNCKNITPARNNYIATLSKQSDRANRQFLSALLTLKQLKSPNIEMNIKTQNAFVSNNQQINVNKENNEAK